MAGADIFLMPSLYEPCGLTQMRAQRYGALPVVRRVGGLADTVEDGVTGFLFDAYIPDAFQDAAFRALECYAGPRALDAMMRHGHGARLQLGARRSQRYLDGLPSRRGARSPTAVSRWISSSRCTATCPRC